MYDILEQLVSVRMTQEDKLVTHVCTLSHHLRAIRSDLELRSGKEHLSLLLS